MIKIELYFIAQERHKRLLKENQDGIHDKELQSYKRLNNLIEAMNTGSEVLNMITEKQKQQKLDRQLKTEIDKVIQKTIDDTATNSFRELERAIKNVKVTISK